jgi:hypothetical protein
MTIARFPLALLGVACLALLAASCASPDGSTPEEERASTLAMREEALAALYAENPKLREEVEKSAGYAVFSSFSVHPGMLSFASGYGVLSNKISGEDTFVHWERLTIGPGIAVKGLYSLYLIYDPALMEHYEGGKWTAFGQAEASFVFGDFGGALEGAWVFNSKADAYYVTHTGVALELELFGVGHMGISDDLNAPPEPAPVPQT